jgi:hypothetical protein
LTQYSLKAKDLSTALVLGGDASDKAKTDKLQLAETSSTSSLGELNNMLKKKAVGKENKTDRGLTNGAYSRASKSTAAMSYAGGAGNN